MAWNVTETIKSGGNWTTLADFEGDHDGDTPATGALTGQITGVPADTGTVYWAGWQSGQTSTLKIVIESESTANETDGTDGSGDDAILADTQAISEGTNAMFMDWKGLEWNGVFINLLQDGGGETRIAKCFFHDWAANRSGIHMQTGTIGADFTLKVGGCLFDTGGTDSHLGGIFLFDTSVTTVVEIFNCTVFNCWAGIYEAAGSFKVRNCACANSTNDDFKSISDEDYCAATDASANGANSVADSTLTTTDSDDFTAPSTGDYTVFDANSVLDEAGENRAESWFTTLVPTALNGVAWKSTPAIGCYELAVAGGGRIMSSLVNHGGLAGLGGIAGQGGGLAG